MVPLLAAILLAGAAGAGPVLVSDACNDNDTTTTGETVVTRCAVESVDRAMKAKAKPAELKVCGGWFDDQERATDKLLVRTQVKPAAVK